MSEIIYFLPDVDAGVASIVRNLLKYRPEGNHKYKVIFTRDVERDAVWIKDRFNVDEQVVFEYSKYENLYNVFYRLRKHINQDSILVANDGLELRMVRVLKLTNPVTYILHGDFGYYYMLINQNKGFIDQYITYSQHTKNELLKRLHKKDFHKVHMLYYPVPDVSLNKEILKETDLLFAGTLTERKGVQYLKGIFKNVQYKKPEVSLTIVGSGEWETQLKEEFKNENNVLFKGQLKGSEVIEEMSKAKIFLFPSLSEGLPNVVVEAMKAKCVPVCFNIKSGIPDLIDHGENGFIAPVGDEEIFAAHAVNLLENLTLVKDMGEKASLKASHMFEPKKNSDLYEELIAESTSGDKNFPKHSLGGMLHKPYLPNWLVKTIRKKLESIK